uniref:protein-tyrosine-phosphatase n=2 Tax=Mesocestoides corti TaxID=53468 RepID=A0A5K3F6T0_MESCO
MPLKLNFKRTHRYNVSAKDLFVIPIYTLDASCVEYTVSPSTTGRDALEYVAQRLDIEYTCFFGFRYESWTDNQRWLFLNKPVKKQLDKYARQHALVLNIMLFIDNPQYLPDPKLRRQFYLQLRQDVLTKQLKIASKQAIKLMAYSLQAEYGDFVDFETTAHLWRERPMVPTSAIGGSVELGSLEHIDDIVWGYCQLRGVSQDNAIWYYLDEIRKLSNYGVQLFFGSTVTGEAAQLGVSRNGLTISTISPLNSSVSKQKWEDIKDLAYSRKTFTIQLLKKTKPIHFVFEDTQDARYLWNFCIQMHNSYIHYWTHVRTSQAAHVSDPPELLRASGIQLPTSTSSPTCDFGGNSPKFSSKCGSETSGVVVNNSNSTTTIGSVASMHAAISQVTNNSLTSLQQPHTSHPVSSSLPACGSTDAEHEAAKPHQTTPTPEYNAQDVGEGKALMGQWSVRSAADTLDSQMVANRCVACLPVARCLRRGTGSKLSGQATLGGLSPPSSPPPPQSVDSTPLRRRHHHHRKHRLQQTQLPVTQGTTSAQEAAARYDMSLADSSSGSSSESEFESDVCSTSAETSSSSNSSRRGDGDGDPQQQQQQQHGFRRLLAGSHTGVGAAVSLRPILSSFNQHHYRLQQNWREEGIVPGQNQRGSLARQIPVADGKSITGEGHGWLASAKRLTSALSESLTRRALSANAPAVSKASPSPTPQLLARAPKSIGIAQVIRPEPATINSTSSSLEGGGGAIDENHRRPNRPPLPPGGAGGGGGPVRHPPLGYNPNAPQRGASAGPATLGTTPSTAAGSSSSYPLHRSLYEVPAETRFQICLQPPSPHGSQEEASWCLVQHPGVWINQMNTASNITEPRQQAQQQVYFEGKSVQPTTSNSQQVMISSSMTSSSTSTSTSSAGAVAVAASVPRSNSSSPSSPASSIVEDEMMLMLMGREKEDDSSSTMSYSVCGGGTTSGKTAAVVAPIQKQPPDHQQQQQQQPRQRSLSGSGSPLHLLTNSDIHQLLNLTKMRETALVHRLLAEYRQTLLLQQSLHTNSMSTPNLAASQELNTASSANGPSNSGNGGGGVAAQSFGANCCHQRCNAQRRTESREPSGSCPDNGGSNRGNNRTSCCAHQTPRGHQLFESSNYVNACAFQCHHGCLCGSNPMQTSVHSTTDNDSNATFRVLSEADGGRNQYPSSRHGSNHHRHHREHHHFHQHHYEDSCTNSSDLMTSSICSQQGWNMVAKSSSFHHQPHCLGSGRSRHAHEMCKSATPDNFRRQTRCDSPVKADLPDMIVGLPQSTSGQVHETTERRISSDLTAANSPPQLSAGFGRSRTFTHSPPGHVGMRVAFAHDFERGGGSGHPLVGEYENLEADSPPVSSVNPKSTTDVSAKSSSSDISFEDFKFTQRLQRRNPKSKLSTAQCEASCDRHHSCVHRGHHDCRCVNASAAPSKRSTLPSTSCDDGGGHVQLCREHLRALEKLKAPKDVHVDTPMIQRRKQKRKAQKHKQPCYSYCSHRFVGKAHSFDPYQQKSSSLRHRCSASPVFSVEGVESRCDLCRRQRRWRVDFGRRRCSCEGAGGSDDNGGASDEEEDEEDGFSSSRAASDSSLTSSLPAGIRDAASIMVSSYEFECQQQQHQQSHTSFDSVSGGAAFRRCRNKPPTPKPAEDRRGLPSRMQHVNFCDEKHKITAKTGRAMQISPPQKLAVSPPTAEGVGRAQRPRTLLPSSASSQMEDRQPDTPSTRHGGRLAGSREVTPVRRVGGAGGGNLRLSRTLTPDGPTNFQTGGSGGATPGGGGLLYTASMTFTPSSSSTASARGQKSGGSTGAETNASGKENMQQTRFQRGLAYNSPSAASNRGSEERPNPFSKKAHTPAEKRKTNVI